MTSPWLGEEFYFLTKPLPEFRDPFASPTASQHHSPNSSRTPSTRGPSRAASSIAPSIRSIGSLHPSIAKSHASKHPSQHSSKLSSVRSVPRVRKKFKSSRLVGEFEKPWMVKGKQGPNWDTLVFYGAAAVGLGLAALMCFRVVSTVPKHDYCMVLNDDFQALDTENTWNHEIQMNGFGTGSFDWTTDSLDNSYVDKSGLHIVPTMTLWSTNITGSQLLNGYTVNLTADGTCTNRDQRVSGLVKTGPCTATSNVSSSAIINPVRSARLTTAGKVSIRYGRVEVVAKMPRGDWLWPAIWMMPEDSVYGEWPRSGEIDIVETRGNDAQSYPLGNNLISSALHWGTSYDNDAYVLTKGEWGAKRTKYSDGFHTFGLEWSEKYMFMWLDGRLRQLFYMDFTTQSDLWTFGGFGQTKTTNGTAPDDPWQNSTSPRNAPFDQNFYLILNVAVGGTNGFFPDGIGGKPWLDNSANAMRDFWKSNSTWLSTWGAGDSKGMTVRSVKMWQEGKCGTF